ncbi:MAG: hypothetical protein J4F42_06420 [Desulfurellaceae bacterium]|nr:hypothetical protein [Desulfurellaceae bacterium]
MLWKNRLGIAIVGFPSLACAGLLGMLGFYALPDADRPAWLWYAAFGLGLGAPFGACVLSRSVVRRLADLRACISLALERSLPPGLPMQRPDELGLVEDGLGRLLHAQHERLRRLHDARRELEVVLQSMTEGVIVLDADSHIRFSNRAAHNFLELSEETDFQAKPLLEFSRHPVLHDLVRAVLDSPPGAEALRQEIELEGEQSRSVAVSAIQVNVSPQSPVWHAEHPALNGQAVSGVILVLHDLTELRQLEAIRADFVANVSHELRTPLTAIKGYAETLLNGALNDPPMVTRFLAIIDRHSERLSRLIDDLLTLSDLELGKTELRHDQLVFGQLIDEVFELVKDKAASGQVRLSAAVPESLPSLSGDPDRLHQVLLNLVDNAVKYTPTGGRVAVSARVAAASSVPDGNGDGTGQADHGWMEVAVADTGCGIPEADIPRLTQRFYRVDKARSRELGGTGLGLAIVKHIVQAHGGFLHIESQLDRGTTMRVFLPLGARAGCDAVLEASPDSVG